MNNCLQIFDDYLSYIFKNYKFCRNFLKYKKFANIPILSFNNHAIINVLAREIR